MATLLNGERLVGDIKRLEYGKLSFKADAYDTIQVKWEQVVGLTSLDEFEIDTLGGESFFGSLAQGEVPGILIVLSETGLTELSLDEVSSIHHIEQTIWARIDGSISIGLNVATASDLFQYSNHFDATYNARRYRTSFIFDSLVNDPSNEETRTSRQDLLLSSQRRLRGRWSSIFSAVGTSNEELGLKQRATLESVGAYTVLAKPGFLLELGGGLALGREEPESGEAESSFEGLLILSSRIFRFAKRDVDSNILIRLYPSFSTSGRYRVELSARIAREIAKDFFIGGNLKYSYDSEPQGLLISPTEDPEERALKQDLALTFNLGYQF